MASPTLDNTLGAAFLGTIAMSCFYGITVVQTWTYYKRNEADPLYMRALVFCLWVLDSLHFALVVHAAYYYAVINFFDPFALEVPVWSILSQILVTGVSDFAVRLVFCHRVWKLSNRNWYLSTAIVVSSLVVFGGSIAFPVKAFGLPSFAALSQISDILYVSLGAGVAADLLIAGSMCILLARRRTGFSRTDSMVRVLMMYSINTGALTSLCALMTLLTYASMPNNFIFIAFYVVLPKLFLNSLLATLNARRPLRETNSGTMMSIPLSSASGGAHMSFSSRHAQHGAHGAGSRATRDDPVNLRIEVQTTTDTKTDLDGGSGLDEEISKSWHGSLSRRPVDVTVAV